MAKKKAPTKKTATKKVAKKKATKKVAKKKATKKVAKVKSTTSRKKKIEIVEPVVTSNVVSSSVEIKSSIHADTFKPMLTHLLGK